MPPQRVEGDVRPCFADAGICERVLWRKILADGGEEFRDLKGAVGVGGEHGRGESRFSLL